MNTLEKDMEAFERLVNEGAFIPQWLKDGMTNGLNGGAIPNQEQILRYTSLSAQQFYEELVLTGKSHDIKFTSSQQEDLKQCAVLCDNMINITVRTHYGWGIPSEEAIVCIEDFLKDKEGLIEMGAGSGLWTGILKARTNKNIIGCELNLRKDTPRAKYSTIINADIKDLMQLYPEYPFFKSMTKLDMCPNQSCYGITVSRY